MKNPLNKPFSRRIEKAITDTVNGTRITRYLYDENNTLKTKYTHNIGIDDPLAMERNNETYYYHKDGLGSVIAITDGSGNIVQTYEYDAFGNITNQKDASFDQPYTFTGREYDPETGLYYYRARYYNPTIGRFMSEDPIGFAAGDVNLYRYVGNNPLRFIDSYGFDKRETNIRTQSFLYRGKCVYTHGSLGDLLIEVQNMGRFYLSIREMNKADKAILQEQCKIRYGREKRMFLLIGTIPPRFVGVSETRNVLVNSDTRIVPVRIKGLLGSPKAPGFPNICDLLKWRRY